MRRWIPQLWLALSTALWSLTFCSGRLGSVIDLPLHYQWATQYQQALLDGWWYPRWNASVHDGLGDAAFQHLHPLFYALSALLNLALQDMWTSMRTVVVAAHFSLGLACRHVALRWSTPAGALLAALFVQWAPIYFMQVVFLQMLPSLLAMLFAAWALGQILRLDFDARRMVLAALALTGLILSHVLVGFMMLLCLALALPLCALLCPLFPGGWTLGSLLRHAAMVAAASAMGVALSAFYLLPALLGRTHIQPDAWWLDGERSPSAWREHFALWGWQSGMDWLVVHWLNALAPLLALLLFALCRRRFPARWAFAAQVPALDALFGLALAALLLAAPLSRPLWQASESLQQLQFPWRLVDILSLAAALLCAPFAARRGQFRGLWAVPLLIQLGVTVSLVWVAWQVPAMNVPQVSWQQDDMAAPEYLPAAVPADWRAQVAADFPCRDEASTCQVLQRSSHGARFVFSQPGPSIERLPVFYHPGWGVRVSGTAVPATADAATGLLQIALPAGRHEVALRWKGTPLDRWGSLISMAGLVLLWLAMLRWFYQAFNAADSSN